MSIDTHEILVRRRVRLYDKTCAACGAHFKGPTIRIYCSKGCQTRAMSRRYRARQRAAGEPLPKTDGPLKEWQA